MNRRAFALIAVALFSLEVAIAVFFKTGFIRHTFGDFLVVILIYCTLMALTKFSSVYAAVITLLIAVLVETAQVANVLARLGLDRTQASDLILGSTFSWGDIGAYILGVATALIATHLWHQEP
ncbi:MAG: DUF2809 domain-containing protein [Parvularculaceae bacterium]